MVVGDSLFDQIRLGQGWGWEGMRRGRNRISRDGNKSKATGGD